MSILVLSDAETLGNAVRDAVGDAAAVRTVPISTGVRADTQGVLVAIVDGTGDVSKALQIAQEYDSNRPDITLVIYAKVEASTVARAMQSGVRDILPPGADDDRIRESVKRAIEVADRRQSMRATEDGSRNRLAMVMSPKGGAGKTTIAANLAVGLASRAPKQVVLIDADLQFGDVSNALRLLAETNVRDAIAGGLQDATEVKVHLTPHRSGVFALCAPDMPGVADEITPQAFTRAVSLLASEFPFVVLDTDPGLGERTLALMDHATDLVFVAATDVASVRGLHKTIEALDSIGMTAQERHFVLNRADAKVGLEITDIAATIGMEPDVLVPSHRSLPISMNQGTPILEEGAEFSPASAALWQLVDRFLPLESDDHDQAGRKAGLLRRRS